MSKKLIDLTGRRYGRLLVLARHGYVQLQTKQPTWLCQCDCGNTSVVTGMKLRSGSTKSCGCLAKDLRSSGSLNKTHGYSKTATYNSWRSMKERCDSKSNSHYKAYGGRGITYDPRWSDFENFLADMGERPKGTTLNRIDNDKGYSKENCEWSTTKAQNRNTSRSVKVTWKGDTKCLTEWAETLGITDGALAYRIKKFGLETAMTMPKKSAVRAERPHL